MSNKEMIDWLDSHGCSNHGCEVRHTPVQVGTNAICSCIRSRVRDNDWIFVERVVRFKQAIAADRIEELQSELASYMESDANLRKRVEQLNEQLGGMYEEALGKLIDLGYAIKLMKEVVEQFDNGAIDDVDALTQIISILMADPCAQA